MFSKVETILLCSVIATGLFLMALLYYTISYMWDIYEAERTYFEEQWETIQQIDYNYHVEQIILSVKNMTTPYSDNIKVNVTVETRERIDALVASYEEEIVMLAKVVYREARGLDRTHVAAVAWCVLNRVDYYDSTITSMVTAPGQFAWKANTPVHDYYYDLAKDVVTRWLLEKEGCADVGRVLPKEYRYFFGYKGLNYFRKTWQATSYWDWSLPSPY